MCGLSGIYGAIGKAERHAFGILQMFAQLRGRDSSGVGLIYHNKKRKPDILKSVGGQESLVIGHTDHFDQFNWTLDDTGLACIIGHSRWATIGGVTEDNAHPFHIKDIIGCHNGTISPYNMIHLDSHKYTLTDSEIIMSELAEGENIADIIEFLHGAWALTWYNTKEKLLHMCRNKERTLFVAKHKDGKTISWASESWMLNIALARSGIKHEEVAAVVVDKHLVWKVNKKGVVVLDKVNPAVGGKTKTQGWGWGSAWGSGIEWLNKNKGEEKKGNVYPLHSKDYFEEGYTKTFGQTYVPRRRFEHLTRDGCSNCTGDIGWDDRESLVWADPETPLCIDCAEYLTGKAEVN